MHLIGCFLKLCDFCGILLILLLLFFKAALTLFHKKAVIPGIELCFSVDNFYAALRYFIQKVPVMGDRKHCTAKACNILFQPFRGVEIQMVGRFIQKQNIRIFENQASEIHPRFFATGKIIKKPFTHVRCNVKPACYAAALCICFIAAEAKKITLEAVIFTEKGIIRLPLREKLFDFFHPLLGVKELMLRCFQHILSGPSIRVNGNL